MKHGVSDMPERRCVVSAGVNTAPHGSAVRCDHGQVNVSLRIQRFLRRLDRQFGARGQLGVYINDFAAPCAVNQLGGNAGYPKRDEKRHGIAQNFQPRVFKVEYLSLIHIYSTSLNLHSVTVGFALYWMKAEWI